MVNSCIKKLELIEKFNLHLLETATEKNHWPVIKFEAPKSAINPLGPVQFNFYFYFKKNKKNKNKIPSDNLFQLNKACILGYLHTHQFNITPAEINLLEQCADH